MLEVSNAMPLAHVQQEGSATVRLEGTSEMARAERGHADTQMLLELAGMTQVRCSFSRTSVDSLAYPESMPEHGTPPTSPHGEDKAAAEPDSPGEVEVEGSRDDVDQLGRLDSPGSQASGDVSTDHYERASRQEVQVRDEQTAPNVDSPLLGHCADVLTSQTDPIDLNRDMLTDYEQRTTGVQDTETATTASSLETDPEESDQDLAADGIGYECRSDTGRQQQGDYVRITSNGLAHLTAIRRGGNSQENCAKAALVSAETRDAGGDSQPESIVRSVCTNSETPATLTMGDTISDPITDIAGLFQRDPAQPTSDPDQFVAAQREDPEVREIVDYLQVGRVPADTSTAKRLL